MSLISKPFTWSAGTTIIASEHNSNADTIYSDYNGNITNANISGSAAIAYSKLSLTNSVLNADINSSAAIVASKLDLTSPNGIGTTAPAAGKFTTLEATSTLKLGTTNQGDILYDNGTSLIRLTPGTAGQALLTGGASANPSWGAAGALTLISNTVISTAATTGNITMVNTNYYKVLAKFNTFSADDIILLTIDNLGTTNNRYMFNGRTSGGAITGGSSGAAAISLGTSIKHTTDGFGATYCVIDMTIYPGNGPISVSGTITYVDTAGGLLTSVYFSGQSAASTGANFQLFTSGGATFSGNVYLYKYSLS